MKTNIVTAAAVLAVCLSAPAFAQVGTGTVGGGGDMTAGSAPSIIGSPSSAPRGSLETPARPTVTVDTAPSVQKTAPATGVEATTTGGATPEAADAAVRANRGDGKAPAVKAPAAKPTATIPPTPTNPRP